MLIFNVFQVFDLFENFIIADMDMKKQDID
jgi:hypothetical protein